MGNILEIKKKVENLTALFVEDEESIRESTGLFLKKLFKNVHICSNGEEGLASFKNNSDISIVLTDIKMPKMDGVTMAQNIHQINNNIKIVFITASRGEHVIPNDLEHIYLTKPITYQTLLDCLASIQLEN